MARMARTFFLKAIELTYRSDTCEFKPVFDQAKLYAIDRFEK